MEAIKKKMQTIKLDKDNAMDKVEAQEALARDANLRVTKDTEELETLKKRLAQGEAEFVAIQETLAKTQATLEAKEKAVTASDMELNNLGKKVQQVEEKFEDTEGKLKTTNDNLVRVMQQGDDSERMRKVLENRAAENEENTKLLEAQLKEATALADENDRKCNEVGRTLVMFEEEVEYAEERAKCCEMKLIELEEEVKVVGNNLKSLEVTENKAVQIEAELKRQVKNLSAKLKQTEARAEFADRTVQKLLREVDRIEDELKTEQEKFKNISTELENTFAEMTGY